MRSKDFDAARRGWLTRAAIIAGGAALSTHARLLMAAGDRAREAAPGFGPLKPVKDLATGLPLLELPEGFSYRTLGWAGEALADGTPTPNAHDGMGVVAARGHVLTLVRNQEVVNDLGHFGPAKLAYDPAAGGGTVTLEIDARDGTLIRAWPSLSGTLQNCAGGVTPWGTWLSCEEFVFEHEDLAGRDASKPDVRIREEHGFVFEVDPSGKRMARKLEGLGQFRHEAAAVHAPTGVVYLTEDREPHAGFYRFLPKTPGDLAAGGSLQMLAAVDAPDLRRGLHAGQTWATRWVDIADPGKGNARPRDGMGVVEQGLAAGGSKFTRLEGCFPTRDAIYFTATNGGDASSGQVFAYYPKGGRLKLLFESTGLDSVNYPDNICFSPRGGLVLCEDGNRKGQYLHGLTADGRSFPFARNAVVLEKAVKGFTGDFRGSEWAGACFSPDGRWLFANVYSPGFTVAITGPWRQGLI